MMPMIYSWKHVKVPGSMGKEHMRDVWVDMMSNKMIRQEEDSLKCIAKAGTSLSLLSFENETLYAKSFKQATSVSTICRY